MQDIRIGVVQMTSKVGDIAGNIDKTERFVKDAASKRVDLLCFPELSISGYNAGNTAMPTPESFDGPSVAALAAIASQYKITLMAGLLERDISGIVYNAQIVFGSEGVVGRYRKTHVPTTEIGTWRPGSDLQVFDHPKVRFGLEICYDSHFPEVSTELAESGAEILFFPHASNGVESAMDKKARWLRYMPARAYDNTVYIAVCNQVGDNGTGRNFAGVSFICDTQGLIAAESASSTDEQMVVADLKAVDLNKARSVPETFFRHFRRPEIYQKWLRERS